MKYSNFFSLKCQKNICFGTCDSIKNESEILKYVLVFNLNFGIYIFGMFFRLLFTVKSIFFII